MERKYRLLQSVGVLAYCKKMDPNKTNLGPWAIKCVFVGYASNSKAYRLLSLQSNVIIEPRNIEFFENLLSDSLGKKKPWDWMRLRISFYLVEGNK